MAQEMIGHQVMAGLGLHVPFNGTRNNYVSNFLWIKASETSTRDGCNRAKQSVAEARE
jgi:hypothetical protein